MTMVGKVDHRVKDYLYTIGHGKWGGYHDLTKTVRIMTSTIVKCINDCLVEVCELHILGFLEEA